MGFLEQINLSHKQNVLFYGPARNWSNPYLYLSVMQKKSSQDEMNVSEII